MIYVGISPYKKEDGEYMDLIKIGYTQDENRDKRLLAYTSHNPGFKFLFEFLGGTEEHERKLHYKFREFLMVGREWFTYCEEIIEYFKSATVEDFSKLPINPMLTEKANRLLLKSRKVVKLLDYVLRLEGREDIITTDDYKDMIQVVKYESTTIDSIFEDLQSSKHYPSLSQQTWKEVESELFPSLGSEIDEFFSRYDQLTTYLDKIHMIVDYLIKNPEYREAIIGNLSDSDKIKQQLITLGPDRIKSLGYNITKIKQAMGITIFDKNTFMEEIYSNFIPGQRYSKKYIKEKLGDIYTSADYNGTPKASDLGEWFEIKECKVVVNGQRDMGFEIISKK